MQNLLVTSKISKRIEGQLSIHGVSLTEYLIMSHLNSSVLKTMRRIELAEHVGISASGVTRLIAPMEKLHIVEKEANPRDARQSLVKLSETGQQLFNDCRASFEDSAGQLMGNLTAQEVEKLMKLQIKMYV
jgi:DNA-binding MarR family transcriptional regulator